MIIKLCPEYINLSTWRVRIWPEPKSGSKAIFLYRNTFAWCERYYLSLHGPFARYVKLRVVHAPRMPGTFSPPPQVSDPDMHHGTCVTHVLWCMPGSLTSGSLRSQRREKRSWRMRNPQLYVSGKRPISQWNAINLVNPIHHLKWVKQLTFMTTTSHWNDPRDAESFDYISTQIGPVV